jgi:hypothetical protein
VRRLGRILLVAFAAGYLAACTQVVDSTTEIRYGQYNYTTDWAKNEAILLNIVRASQYQPLNFLVYQAYTGTATATATASAPSFIIGPDRVASQKQYTIGNTTLNATGTGTGSISVQNLDTQDFYDALLSPVDFTNLYAFQRQGYPRELLFRLFTDYVSLKPPMDADSQGRHAHIIYNDPSPDKSCYHLEEQVIAAIYPSQLRPQIRRDICFKDLVEFGLLSGLSSEIRNVVAPASSGKQTNPGGAPSPAATTPGSTGSASTSKPATEARLCFDGALANRTIDEFRKKPPPEWRDDGRNSEMFLNAVRAAEYHPICGGTGPDDVWPTTTKQAAVRAPTPGKGPPTASNQSAGTNTLTVVVKTLTGQPIWDIHKLQHDTVEIGTRSTYAIYNFLGRLMNKPDSDVNIMINLLDDEDHHLLTVNKGQPAGCFVSAILDLGIYCVPIDGAENTKRSFSILSQLLALKTTTGDLQLQPIFRLQTQ